MFLTTFFWVSDSSSPSNTHTHTHTHTHTRTHTHTHTPHDSSGKIKLYCTALSLGLWGFGTLQNCFWWHAERKKDIERERQTERDGRSGGLSLSETLTVPLSTSLTRAIISSTEEKPRWRAVIVTDEISVSLWLDVEPVANVWCVWPWRWLF